MVAKWPLGGVGVGTGRLEVGRAITTQFFLYLPSMLVSSEQDWVERDILLLISNLPLQLGFPFVTLYPPPLPTPACRLRPVGGVTCCGFLGLGSQDSQPRAWALGGADFWALVSPKCKEGSLQPHGWEMKRSWLSAATSNDTWGEWLLAQKCGC